MEPRLFCPCPIGGYARTIPETGTAYQEWLGRWATTLGEDSQRLFADGQKVLAAGGRLFTNGWDGRGD
jgi:hypothetical protein